MEDISQALAKTKPSYAPGDNDWQLGDMDRPSNKTVTQSHFSTNVLHPNVNGRKRKVTGIPEQTSNHFTVWSLKQTAGLLWEEIRLAERQGETLRRVASVVRL